MVCLNEKCNLRFIDEKKKVDFERFFMESGRKSFIIDFFLVILQQNSKL